MEEISPKQYLAAAVALALLAIAVFHELPSNGYTLDSIPAVRDNPLAQAGVPVARIFTSPYWDAEELAGCGLYRPVPVWTFSLTRTWFADPLFVDHFLNGVLHFLCAALVGMLALRFGARIDTASLLAGLYLVHPVQAEVVASLVGRSDLLACFFALAALNLALARDGASRVPGVIAAVSGLFMLSLLSKESAAGFVVAIPLAVAFSAVRRGDSWPVALRDVAPFAIALVLTLGLEVGLRIWVLGSVGVDRVVDFTSGGPLAQRWGALAFLTLYAQKLFWPWPLLPDYSSGVIPSGSMSYHLRAVLGLGGVVAAVAWIGAAVRSPRRFGVATLGLVLFGLAIAPVSNLVVRIGLHFGERVLYLPLAFALLAVLTGRLCRRGVGSRIVLRREVALACGIAIVVGGWVTARRVPEWADNRALLAAGIRDAPGNFHLQMSYGAVLAEGDGADDASRAVAAFEAARAIAPETYDPFAGLGMLALRSGDFQAALRAFEAALERADEARWPMAAINLAEVHYELGDSALAVELWERTAETHPDFSPAHRRLGDYWFGQGRLPEALAAYERALAADPRDPETWQRAIWIHLGQGNIEEAKRLSSQSPPETLSRDFARRLRDAGLPPELFAAVWGSTR